jgi:hypothetical protein
MTYQGESKMVLRVSRFASIAVATALALAGCNGDEDDDAMTSFDPPTSAGETDPTNGTDPDETGDPSDDDTAAPDVAFSEVRPIFQQRCVDGCHEPGGLWFTYDMTDIHASMVEVTGPSQGMQCFLIEPGDPDRSYIWHKINGTHTMNCSGSGAQMPVLHDAIGTADPLPQAQLDLIEGWILSGAPS